MEELINDNDSIYHRLLEKYFDLEISRKPVLVFPEWLRQSLEIGGVLFLMALFVTIYSRIQVGRKTRELFLKNQALEESEEKFKAIFEQTAMGVSICESRTGRFLRVNERYCRITGYSKEELCHQMTFHQISHPGDRENDLACLDSIQEGKSYNLEKRYIHKNGSIVWMRVNISPLWREGRQQEYHIAIAEDITAHKKTQERLIQSEKMMTIGGLAAGIAHEIGTPLADMMMKTQIAINRLSKPTKKNAQYALQAGTSFESVSRFMEERGVISTLQSIHDSGKHAVSTTQGILAFARKSAVPSARQPNDITRLLENAVLLIKSKSDYRHIGIEKIYGKDLPLVFCEGNKIQQVFLNILLNGAEAMCSTDKPADGRKFFLHVSKNDFGLCVRIQDTGPGFDDVVGKSLFEPFFSTNKNGKGVGLGLSISYYIVVKDHGGNLRAVSTSRGAEFIIDLPLRAGTGR